MMGRDLGEITPMDRNRWFWPYPDMEVGDSFTVSSLSKSLGSVQQYAYLQGRRLGRKFQVSEDGGVITVERLDDRATRQPGRKSPPAELVGGDGELYLGVMERPDDGMWGWSVLKGMTPGQYFHVDHAAKHPEKLRNVIVQTAKREDLQIGVVADDPSKPGYAKVFCRHPQDREEEVALFTYAQMHKLIPKLYGVSINRIEFWPSDKLQRFSFKAIRPLPQTFAVVEVPGDCDYGMALFEDWIDVKSLPKGTTLEWWKRIHAGYTTGLENCSDEGRAPSA